MRENVRDGSDAVTINGRTRHIIGYLEDFLFTPEQAGGPVARLSGGERNRLLLARLFTKPSNVWSWTNRPTTWTWRRWNCWRTC